MYIHIYVDQNTSHVLKCYSIIKYLEDKKWIKPSQQVLKRNVNFVKNTDDAIAEICLVDETDGNIALVENKRVCYTYLSLL